jgi:nucleotide-binding universal stress UspA family protein
MTSESQRCHERPNFIGPRIVVGVDGSASSMRALAWAAAEAHMRGAALEVVHVDFSRHEALEALAPGMLKTEQSVLNRAVIRAKALAPGAVVTGRLCDPPAGRALIEASEGAEMLVVGSRGLSGLKELTLGSVSSECAHHARCPVVVVRPAAAPPIEAGRRLVGAAASGGDGQKRRRVGRAVGLDGRDRAQRRCFDCRSTRSGRCSGRSCLRMA